MSIKNGPGGEEETTEGKRKVTAHEMWGGNILFDYGDDRKRMDLIAFGPRGSGREIT